MGKPHYVTDFDEEFLFPDCGRRFASETIHSEPKNRKGYFLKDSRVSVVHSTPFRDRRSEEEGVTWSPSPRRVSGWSRFVERPVPGFLLVSGFPPRLGSSSSVWCPPIPVHSTPILVTRLRAPRHWCTRTRSSQGSWPRHQRPTKRNLRPRATFSSLRLRLYNPYPSVGVLTSCLTGLVWGPPRTRWEEVSPHRVSDER